MKEKNDKNENEEKNISSFYRKPGYPENRYTYLKKIINGSSSKLYLAYDNTTKIKVIIKKIPFKENWIDEFRALHFLNKEKLHTLIDSYRIRNNIYLVTPYIDSYNLSEYIASNAPYSEEDALKIFKKMLNEVKLIHDKGLAHLDIKCDNFMMTVNKNNEIDVKLIDYGHTEFINKNSDDITCKYGTYLYLCPEGYDNKFSTSSDIWSLGICFHMLLSCKFPFSGSEYEHNRRHDVRTWIPEISPIISPKAASLIRMMLHKDPKYRLNIDQIINSNYISMMPNY